MAAITCITVYPVMGLWCFVLRLWRVHGASGSIYYHECLLPIDVVAHHIYQSYGRKSVSDLANAKINIHSQVGLGGTNESVELPLIFAMHLAHDQDGRRFLVHNSSQTSLSFDNDIRNTHLPAERRNENDEFDRIHIMREDNKGSFLRLNESNSVVKAILHKEGFGGGLNFMSTTKKVEVRCPANLCILILILILGRFFRHRRQPNLLFLLGFRTVSTRASRINRGNKAEYWTDLFKNLNNCAAVFLSSVFENCAIAGGTFSRWWRITF